MAHQSLYRRYRPQRFSEIRGQHHVRQALQNAVREGRWSHAYLFSGPRGTGKTTTARVLAKALNCEDLGADGEPCGACGSCTAIEQGRSFDLHELDAASNNKVDDIRDLISKVHLGSPGRTKVYILDEVHMLTPGAENALLKTLEEPPDHVVFVLATTEPHKVVPTIRSRTQHFEFQLLPGDELAEHVRWVIEDAGLAVGDDAVDYVLRAGGGSARDTLSALDLVSAAGGVPAGSDVGAELARAIADADPGAALATVQGALESGREPRTIAEEALGHLRDAFLAAMGAPLAHLSDAQAAQARQSAAGMSPATVTRSLESLGAAVVEMRQAPDPRIPLEVCLLRLTRRLGTDPAALLERIEALEAEVAALRAGTAAPAAPPAPAAAAPATTGATAAAARGDEPARTPGAARAGGAAGEPTGPEAAPGPTPGPDAAAAQAAAAAGADGRGEEERPTSRRRAGAPAAPGRPARPADAARRTLSSREGPPPPPAPARPAGRGAPARPGDGDRRRPATPPRPGGDPTPGPPRSGADAPPGPPRSGADAPPGPPPAAAGPAPAPAPSPAGGTGTGRTPADRTRLGQEGPAAGAGPSLDALEAAWAATVLDALSNRARARYKVGRFLALEGATARFALPNAIHRDRCAELRAEVEAALVAAVGHPLELRLEVDQAPADGVRDHGGRPATSEDHTDDDVGDIRELADADDVATSGIERLTRAFPGSEVITHDD